MESYSFFSNSHSLSKFQIESIKIRKTFTNSLRIFSNDSSNRRTISSNTKNRIAEISPREQRDINSLNDIKHFRLSSDGISRRNQRESFENSIP